MMNSSSFKDADRHVPVRIDYSRARQKYARGGLAQQAENVRQSGRMGDDMVVHVNKREFDEMCQRWGKPTVNPKTGMPEFFLGDLFGSIGNLVTGGSSYIPLVGDSISGYLQSSPGVAQAIGSGLLGAGAGQLLGGNTKSTLIGAGLGALAPTLLGGASLFSGLGGAGTTAGGLSEGDNVFNQMGNDIKESGKNLGIDTTPSSGGGLFGGMSPDKKAMAGIIGALTLASMIGGARSAKPNAAQKAAEQANKQAQQQFNQSMPVMEFARAYNAPRPGLDPKLYGFGGQSGWEPFFTNNQLPRRVTPIQGQLAKGGRVGYADGGVADYGSLYASEFPSGALTEREMRMLQALDRPPSRAATMAQDSMRWLRGLMPESLVQRAPFPGGVEMLDRRPAGAGAMTERERQMLMQNMGGRYARGGRTQPPMGALAAMHVSGSSPNYVQGPGGAREDKIPALLSNNEYVFDAETTSLLGDGDPSRGAKKLDQMRANIRAHKGRALAKGKISPDAKPAERYLGGRI